MIFLRYLKINYKVFYNTIYCCKNILFLYWGDTISLLYKLEYQDNFTDLEKGIANYILDHKDYIVDLKITDLAEITYTSPSTISRFCKKLGEKNYNDFRIHFASSVIGDYKSKTYIIWSK